MLISDNFLSNLLTKRKFELMNSIRCQIRNTITTYLWGNSATKTTTFSSQRSTTSCSSHQWASTTSYNKSTFPSDTCKVGGKKETTSTFNWSIFDTLTIVPTMEVKCIVRWIKHWTCLICWWGNLCRIETVVYNTH
jgi:hypothetical protein